MSFPAGYANMCGNKVVERELGEGIMKTRRAIITCLMCLASVAVWCEAGGPVYPLYAIASGSPELSEADIEVLAGNFTLVQANLSEDVISKLHKVNPEFKAVRYFNSTYTSGADMVQMAEGEYRQALTMFKVAQLESGVDDHVASFVLKPVSQGKPISLRASTVSGNLSSDASGRPSTKHYVTWIRIGDELMRIDSFDRGTSHIYVTRGFDGTKSEAHDADSPVFSPIYLGSTNDTGAWPGGPGDFLRYAFDPSNSAGVARLMDGMVEAFSDGYDGFWLDICSASPFNMCDSDGQHVTPWDFRTGQLYNKDTYREGQEIKVRTIQDAIHEKYGRWPVMIANNMKARTFELGEGGQKQMLIPNKLKPRPIEGYCIENYAGGFAARASKRKGKVGPDYHDLEKWRDNQMMLMTCAQEGLAAYPMIANAGSKSEMLEGLGAVRDQFETFAYASYLLCIEKDSPTRLGLPALYKENGRRFAKLHPRYTWPIGGPVETVSPAKLDKYKVEGRHSYRRYFINGVVLVNPSDKDDKEIKFDGGGFINPETGKRIKSVQMKAHTGKILLRNM